MITVEVREWMEKVKRGQYSYDDALYQFKKFMPFLTKEEMLLIKRKIEEIYD